jgi:MoxR-like ATPase
LLYTFDAVRRLYDIQERLATHVGRAEGDVDKQATALPNKKGDKVATQDKVEKRKYVKLGRLGEAIELSEKNIPSVVLIDEIDKADIDFPNDLLLVLDRLQFEVEEVPSWNFDALQQGNREDRRAFLPLVIITSNREKELPAPFLRRCLFYYIHFPGERELRQIVESHFEKARFGRLFEEALKKFWELHQQKTFTWRKAPSTSELLDWLAVLEQSEREGGITAETVASASLGKLPHLEALVKTQSDLDALSRMQEEHEPIQNI